MKAFKFGIFFSLLLVFASCNNDDDDNNGGTTDPPEELLSIYETAVASADLTILVEALERTGLDETLDQPGSYTVFAPTNDAFTNAGISLDDFTTEELTNLLLNHVLGSEILSDDLANGYTTTLATGVDDQNISLFIDTTNGISLNGDATLEEGGLDIEATNGVIHLIDEPLGIPDVVGHVLANPEFQALAEALSQFDSEFTDLLSGEGPFTVFAPTNAAFENLAATLDLSSLDAETIKSILSYHVVEGENLRAEDLTDGQELTTYNGEVLTVDLTNGTRLVDGTEGAGVTISETNIQGENGVIHQVDRVLLPPSVVDATAGQATIYQMARLTPGYATLALAIEQAGLVEMLNDPDAEFTVFAPNDDAFIEYLSNFENIESIEDIDTDQLADLLLNHLMEGQLFAEDLLAGGNNYYQTMATSPAEDNDYLSLYVNTDDGVILNGISSVVFPDTQAANGVIHLVDNIVDLPTVVTFAQADPNFSTLVEALLSVDESAGYVETLQTPWGTDPAPFTIFAPDNAAFASLLEELGADNLESLDPAVVELTLAYHVIPGANVRSDDISSGTVTTLGGDITVTAGNGVSITDDNGRVSEVTAANVQAYNGVIHVINTVILPPLPEN